MSQAEERTKRFWDLIAALRSLGCPPRRFTFKTDGSGWIWFNRGFAQYAVRYDFETGALIVWRGYLFVKISKRERQDELEDVRRTAEWVCGR